MSTRPHSTRRHLTDAVRFSPAQLRRDMKAVHGFNAKLALLITGAVGTMACAYLFTVLALVSLPAILIQAGVLAHGAVPTLLTKPGLILVVAWVAQTLIQLVLLSIIMVGQDVQSRASDARSQHTFEDTEKIIDALDVETEGGLRTILDHVEALERTVPRRQDPKNVETR